MIQAYNKLTMEIHLCYGGMSHSLCNQGMTLNPGYYIGENRLALAIGRIHPGTFETDYTRCLECRMIDLSQWSNTHRIYLGILSYDQKHHEAKTFIEYFNRIHWYGSRMERDTLISIVTHMEGIRRRLIQKFSENKNSGRNYKETEWTT